MRSRVVGAALVLIGLVASPAAAVDAQDRAASLSTRLMSPFCPGLTIHDCPTQESEDLRAEILGWAEDGWTDEQIVAELRSEYGPSIEAVPSDENAWLIWTIPTLALALGIAGAWAVARRWTRDSSSAPARATSTQEERARLAAELESIKQHNLWRQ